MSAVSLKHLHPKPTVPPVLYALAEMRMGGLARHANLEYSPSTGWRLAL